MMNAILPRGFERFRFLQLTLFVLILLFVSAIFPSALLLRALLALLFLNTLYVTLSAVGSGPKSRGALVAVWLVGTTLPLAADLHLLDRFDRFAMFTSECAYLVLVVIGVVATLRYVLTTRRASLDLIFAAILAYLLIGIGFAMIYTLLLGLNPSAFNGADQAEFLSGGALSSQMIYFSFVTIATLGYGDITAALPLPRLLAALEAVIGQFYIAIVIAWLMSRYVMEGEPPR